MTDLHPASSRSPRHRDSPRVRRLARDAGVDLRQIRRSGLHGRATAADVTAAAASALVATPEPKRPQSAVDARVEQLSDYDRTVAERRRDSLRVSAQLTTVVEVDLTNVSRLAETSKTPSRPEHEVALTALAFVAEAAVRAVAAHPQINARLDMHEGTITYPAGVHLGIAIDTDAGPVVPVVRDAGDLSVAGLARRIAESHDRSLQVPIAADEVSGATLTLTNTGRRATLFETPIINQPESAILAFGAIVRRPVVMLDGEGEESIAIRSMAHLALTYDHRLIDGADASCYLTAVKDRLEKWGAGASTLGSAEEREHLPAGKPPVRS